MRYHHLHSAGKDTLLIVLAKPDGAGGHVREPQLDLLLRSVAKHWVSAAPVVVSEPAGQGFAAMVRGLVVNNPLPFVSFACDDGVVFQRVGWRPTTVLQDDPSVLCFSLRYGENTTTCYPSGDQQRWPGTRWAYSGVPGDFGYPGSVDAHVFRAGDMGSLLGDTEADNPTALECELNERCLTMFMDRPCIASYHTSRYVGVPVNRVSDQSRVRYGWGFPQPAEDLRARWDSGRRIRLESVRLADVTGPHAELPFTWEPDPRRIRAGA